MGLFDEVRIDRDDADLGISRGESFQTKNLYAAAGRFTITQEGKLVEHLYRYESAAKPHERSSPMLGKRVELGDKVIDYHGDILLTRVQSEAVPMVFVARFTHGRLESIWPVEDYPAENRALLIEQGAR